MTPIYQLSCQEFKRIQDKSVVVLQVIQCTFCLFCFSLFPSFSFLLFSSTYTYAQKLSNPIIVILLLWGCEIFWCKCTAALFYLVSSLDETMAIKKKVTCKTSFSWKERQKENNGNSKNSIKIVYTLDQIGAMHDKF